MVLLNHQAKFTAEAMTVHTLIAINLHMAAMVMVEEASMVASASLAQNKVTALLSDMASVDKAKAPAKALAPTATVPVTTVNKVTPTEDMAAMVAAAMVATAVKAMVATAAAAMVATVAAAMVVMAVKAMEVMAAATAAKVAATVATVAAMAAATADTTEYEYFEELGSNRLLSFCVYCSLVKSRKKILCTNKRFNSKPSLHF